MGGVAHPAQGPRGPGAWKELEEAKGPLPHSLPFLPDQAAPEGGPGEALDAPAEVILGLGHPVGSCRWSDLHGLWVPEEMRGPAPGPGFYPFSPSEAGLSVWLGSGSEV